MLYKWLNIGKRRKKLINKIIALDSNRSLEQLSKWKVSNLERKLFFLEHYPNRCGRRCDASSPVKVDARIDELIKKAKDDEIWDETPKKGNWL